MSGDEAARRFASLTALRSADHGVHARRPQPPFTLVTLAIAGAALTVAAAYATAYRVLLLVSRRGLDSPLATALVAAIAACFTLLFLPALAAWRAARRSRDLTSADLAVESPATETLAAARIAAARARSLARATLGYAMASSLLLLLTIFVIAHNLAVGEAFFNLNAIWRSAASISQAFLLNIQIFCIAEVLILLWAMVIVVARMAPGAAGRPVRWLATAYVDLFRAIPAIIAIYLVGFGLPLAGYRIFDDVPQWMFAVIALTLIYGAYVSEVYRAGIESVHPSQTAAARSLGLTYGQTLRHVVVPQALRRVGPPLLNDFISLQKDTALVNVIGATDAFAQAKIAAVNHFNLSSVTVVAILFIVITIPQTRLVDWLLAADTRRHT